MLGPLRLFRDKPPPEAIIVSTIHLMLLCAVRSTTTIGGNVTLMASAPADLSTFEGKTKISSGRRHMYDCHG
jgi:hypothetical protein